MNKIVIITAPPIMDLNMYYSINFKEAHPTLFAQNIIMQNNNVWFKSYDVDLTGYLPIMIYRLCINYTNALTSLNIKGQIKKFVTAKLSSLLKMESWHLCQRHLCIDCKV